MRKYLKYKNKYLQLIGKPTVNTNIKFNNINYDAKYNKYKNKYLILKHKL